MYNKWLCEQEKSILCIKLDRPLGTIFLYIIMNTFLLQITFLFYYTVQPRGLLSWILSPTVAPLDVFVLAAGPEKCPRPGGGGGATHSLGVCTNCETTAPSFWQWTATGFSLTKFTAPSF